MNFISDCFYCIIDLMNFVSAFLHVIFRVTYFMVDFPDFIIYLVNRMTQFNNVIAVSADVIIFGTRPDLQFVNIAVELGKHVVELLNIIV